MLVTIEIPDHVAQELHLDDSTRSRRLLEALLLQRYAEGKSLAPSATASDRQKLSKSEWKAELRAWAGRHKVNHFVDDSRESIYAGRGE